jgi:hypothetical protein
MAPILAFQLKTAPGEQRIPGENLPAGLLLCQWSVQIQKAGNQPSGTLFARQPIPPIGFLPSGEWPIAPAFPLAKFNPVVLVRLAPGSDFYFESSGYGAGTLSFYQYEPLTNSQPVAIINNPSVGVDLTSLIQAVVTSDQNAQNQSAQLAGRLDQLISDNQPATGNKAYEFTAKEWTGNWLDGKFLDPDTNRKSVTFTVPAVDVNTGSPNLHAVHICYGDSPRNQPDDYNWTVNPGGSIDIDGDQVVQQLCCWQDTGTAPTICNLASIFK